MNLGRIVACLLGIAVITVACDPNSGPLGASPTSSVDVVSTPLATLSVEPTPMLAPTSATSPTPTVSPAPTASPTPSALVLGGTWVKPKAGARLTSYTTTLSARPTATGPGATVFTKVVFSATWAGTAKKVMCKATEPDSRGAWACKANLLALGVSPGKVTFSFDVYGDGVPIARSPAGPRRVAYAVPPPRPTDTRWERIGIHQASGGELVSTYRLRWSAPVGYADEFLVYQTVECPRESKQNDGTPCFVAGTPVDASQLELLARAPGEARSVQVEMTEAECGPSYATILLRARNGYGRSVFTIVEALNVDWPDPNAVIC